MNKKFADLFTGYGMTINGNGAYGLVKGYETNAIIHIFDNLNPLTIHFSCYTTSEQKRAIEQAFRQAAIKFCKFNFTEYGIFIGLNDITVGRLIKRMPDLMNQFIGILIQNGALDAKYCPVCGNELEIETTKRVKADGYSIALDSGCVTILNKTIAAENEDFETAPNNYLKGFFGALLGGLAGAAIAIVFYLVGFVSSLSAIISVALGVFLYKKFHGKPNMIMIVIVAATTLVCMVALILGIYISVVGIAAEEAGLSMSAIDAFIILLGDAEFSGYFYSDLGLSLLFSVLGIGAQTYLLIKSIRRKREIR